MHFFLHTALPFIVSWAAFVYAIAAVIQGHLDRKAEEAVAAEEIRLAQAEDGK